MVIGGVPWVRDDGGRADAGFRGDTGDCVTRAIAIATGIPYRVVYDMIHDALRRDPRCAASGRTSPRDGVPRRVYEPFLAGVGFVWTPTMRVGSGCTTHLRADELPGGRIVCRLTKHVTAVVDGVIHDTHDPSRDGTRCVYGYYSKEA